MPLPTSASVGPPFRPPAYRRMIILAGSSEPRATASRAPIFKRRMSSMSSTLASRPVALVASLTLSANMLGVNAFAGVFTHSRIRLVASVRTMASLTAADAARSPLSPRIVSDSTGATALSCLVLSDPASKLLSPIPSVAARARSAVSALAATSLGNRSASRRWPRRRRVRPAACSALRSRTMSSCSTLPTPTSTVHRLGRVLRLWIGTSSMNWPRNSRSLSNCSMAPLSFLSRATASLGSCVCPSRIGRISASASTVSAAVCTNRAFMRSPLPRRAFVFYEPRFRAWRSWNRCSISTRSAFVYRFRPSSSCRLALAMPSRIQVAIVAGETPSFCAASVIE